MDKVQAAAQLRRAIQLFAITLTEDLAMEIATIYPEWEADKNYTTTDGYITYGVNSVGDPQIYKIIQNHTSQSNWTPDITPALYEPIGLNESGYPIWSQPSGSHDAYNIGDIVEYNGQLYKSLIDGNAWSPDAYPQGWEVYVPNE